jgi:hypothetical protein
MRALVFVLLVLTMALVNTSVAIAGVISSVSG